MQLRLTYYRKQILYQYKVYYNISDPEEDQGGTSSEIQKGPSRLGSTLEKMQQSEELGCCIFY